MLRMSLALFLASLALPAGAAAAPQVKLTCTSQGRPLPRKGKLPGALDCELSARKLKGRLGTLRGTLQAVWDEGRGPASEAEKAVAGDKVAFRFRLEPGTAFPACEKLELVGELAGAKGTLGKARLAVAQECPKPKLKAEKASLSCISYGADGTRYLYPGNGAQARPRLVRELNCTILLDKAPASGAIAATLKAGRRTRVAEVRELGAGIEAAATFFPDDDLPPCESFNAEGELTVDGQPIWRGSVPIPQRCGR